MNIYLAGDSIVQNYTNEEFIAGWGQYLPDFFRPEVNIVNYAKGGRSSRLFINEGRYDELYGQVGAGDYVFIEFCHNDDASKEYKTMFNRLVELGVPDENGRYPIIPGERVSKDYLPEEYLSALYADDSITDKQAVIDSIYTMFSQYPSEKYYPYSKFGMKGSYKWFLKQFIDGAREKSAVPVLVTAPARTMFDDTGHIKDGPGLHGGNDFCYIRAVRQLADETDTPLIDLFNYSKSLFENIGQNKIHYITSIKTGNNKGIWPDDFNIEVEKPETVSENTHFNKYGAFLMAKGIAEGIKSSDNRQLDRLKHYLINDLSVVSELKPKGLY